MYWWAYVRPAAVRTFERPWLVNTILFGNYRRLRSAALQALGAPLSGRTVQVACVYGDLTPRLLRQLAPHGQLEVVDVLPIQLDNLTRKLPSDPRVTLTLANSGALPMTDASVDRLLLFFLLHEQPEAMRRQTIAEAMRVVKPGGRIVLVDYHRPAQWHPLRGLMALVFRRLEPFATDLWRDELADYLPPAAEPASTSKRCFFGGLYQLVTWVR